MLEGLVANLLNRFLGMYVKNFDPKQLNVGIWSGDVKLKNLELRREALDQLHLPINVVEGHLGQLVLSIPWSNLRGKPVSVNIEDVFLLAAPKAESDYNPEEEEKRAQAVKIEKLESAELVKEQSTDGMNAEEQQKNQSFTQSLVTAIVDNLQITVQNVHLRYEDSLAAPEHPFALGLSLKEMSAVSTDADWTPSFIQSSSPVTRKLAVLKALALYWNTDATLFGTGKGADVGSEAQRVRHNQLLEHLRATVEGDKNVQYMLKPVSARAGIEMDKSGKVDRPKIKARLLFDEFGLVIDDEQYRDALMLVDLFHYFVRHHENLKTLPKESPKQNPRAWFRFAGNKVLEEIHDREYRWTWEYFERRRDDRNQYIKLFKKKKKDQPMTTEENTAYQELERRLSYEDLRFWRSLARRQLGKENAVSQQSAQKQTWTSWLWGSQQQESNQQNDAGMTEEQRQELYEAIDWNDKKALADSVDLPRDSVKLQIESSLQTGSFTLKRDPHGAANEMLKLVFDDFSLEAQQRPDSFLADVALGAMRIYDGTTKGSLFPQIVRVKNGHSDPDEKSLQASAAQDLSQSKEGSTVQQKDKLFHLVFENNPLDDSADTAVTMTLKSIEVIYNPKLIVEIVKFFKPPERHMESVGALLESAGATVDEIRQQTRAGLEFALEEHKTVNANLDIHAPLIIIPESITEASTLCLIVDAGHVSVTSKLVDKETMKEVQAKQKRQYTEEDYRQLEGLMYDKFLLKLESTQVLIGPGVDETKAELYTDKQTQHLHMIDRINMDFTLETSIVPKAADITRTRVSGHLPMLHASISDKKYKNLMKLIDVATPRFADAHSGSGTHEQDSKAGTQLQQPRSRSQSLAKTKQKEVPILDSDLESEDSADGPEDEKSNKSASLHQRTFELKFTVDRLQGSLYRADPDGKKSDQLLVELVASHFVFSFYLRPFDMVAEVLLNSLLVDDYIETDPTPEFKQIISSKDVDLDPNRDLFSVRFVKVNPESPEFVDVYDRIATNLDVSISTINIVVTRKTLLTLLDFVLLTFTNNEPGSSGSRESLPEAPGHKDDEIQEIKRSPPSNDKIRVKAALTGIALILNNDGVRLATLSLNSGDVRLLLENGTMTIKARIGSLSLTDDINQGAPQDSSLRRLITIEGDDFADFRYRTYDSKADNYPGHDSEVYLRSGSIKINFLEEPFRKIIEFGVKFGKMQAIFNAARQAAAKQATQLQENASKMHFDVLVKTPILVFPRTMVKERSRDLLTVYLGEIYASNEFSTSKDKPESPVVNNLSAGIRHICLTSKLHYNNGQFEESEMIEKLDLDFSVAHVETKAPLDRPDTEIEGAMSPMNLRISQTQLRFLLELATSIPAAFAIDEAAEEQIAQELPKGAVNSDRSEVLEDKNSLPAGPSHLGPEIVAPKHAKTTLGFRFKASMIGLELILAQETEPAPDTDAMSLSKFSLNESDVQLRMISDGAVEAELVIQSFTILDTRRKDVNRFRKIMSLINDNIRQQFMASLTISGGDKRHMIVMLTIDSPRIIFALDYVFALQNFASKAFANENKPGTDIGELSSDPDEDDDEYDDESAEGSPKSQLTADREPAADQAVTSDNGATMANSFRVNVVDAQVILVANPSISNTEAIVLGTKEVLLTQQNSATLQITKVGMFLCRMDKFETSRLRILDDFAVQMSMDSRSQGTNTSLTSIHIGIEPLVLRVSLRDILLVTQIFSKASSFGRSEPDDVTKGGLVEASEPKELPQASKSTSQSARGAPSTVAKKPQKTKATTRSNQDAPAKQAAQSGILKREELIAEVDGIRVVVIGDLHELPLLDLSVKKFRLDAKDWSASMTADLSFDVFMNVYNFSKSAWEPLIEPWQLGFHVSKEQQPEVLSVELFSYKIMEITITSATIALASKSFRFLSSDEDMLSKPRIEEAPYRLRNFTGFDLHVWADNAQDDTGAAAKLNDGQVVPWRFEDATSMRESLSPEGNAGFVGVKLEGSGFDSIGRIAVVREGETLYNLKPRQDNIQHRLLVEVKLGTDNVKYITFRSPLLVENKTQIPIELGIFDPEQGHLMKIENIPPGEGRPAPVGAAFIHSLLLRPDEGFGYEWSDERLFWKDLLKRPTRTTTCRGQSADQSPPFYFQTHAVFDKKDPMTQDYPNMRIAVSAPIEIQNLLPYDFKYRIYDKNTKKDWTNFLRKGGVSPVHVVELSHLLLLSIELQDTVFQTSEFGVINGSAGEDFKRESVLSLKDDHGLELRLKLHYVNIKDRGGAFKVSVYSPYVILNKTGLDVNIQSKSGFGTAKPAAGQAGTSRTEERSQKAVPWMYSYATDDQRNRSMLKIGGSVWSKPQSFDAIGSTFEVVVPSTNGKTELHAGVSVAEGEGNHSLTKVVTVTPRFILKNRMSESIEFREAGSSKGTSLKPAELVPLHFVRCTPELQVYLRFPGENNQWSSPFAIVNVGMTHVKLAKHGQRQQLVRAEIIMEEATIFIHISMETKHWPFSMRNESDMEFLFFQSNPNLEEDEEDEHGDWKPIRYKLPRRSIMPYAWDYPAARNKELILVCGNKERYVKLAEIGNLIPMKLPASQRGAPAKIIDLNIVADGPTQTLVLSNYKPSKSLYRQRTDQSTSSQSSNSHGFEVKKINSELSFRAQLRLAGIGVSLVTKHLKELLYLTLREVEIKYGESKLYQTLNTTIKWVQIDNQLYGGIFPILLYPSVVPKTGKEMEAHPIFQCMITRVKDDSYGVLYIKYASLLLQQITIELDEDFIFALLDFTKVPGASWSEEKTGRLCDEDFDVPEPTREDSGQDVYFELLHLQPMQIDLSFVRTERINAEDTFETSNPIMFFVNVMTMSIGNVNDAPVRLNALMIENARISIPALMNRAQSHYTQEFLRQIHIILGSADFLGNPVGLFNNVSSGVADIFYEPYQGLVMTDRPQDLGMGIAKGASSFVKKSVFGFSDSVAKFTGSMSKGLAAASLDKEFQDQRRMSKSRNRPKHALYGVTSGGNAFASSMASGIGGLARHPLQGAEKEGAVGFVKGVGKGFLGLATKPAIGAFDLASNLAEGVRNTTTVFDAEGLDRVRLTRFIGVDGIVRPYSQREALGQFWLKTAENGKFFHEDYIAHLELGQQRDMLVMLTYDRIMLIQSKKLHAEWEVKLTDIKTITKERTGMNLALKNGVAGPFLPVQDESSRNWLYRQIAIAVNAFNDKYNAKG